MPAKPSTTALEKISPNLDSSDNLHLIVIGASAGGIETVAKLLGDLPGDLPAAVLVVIHISAQSPSLLPQIFQRATQLKAVKVLKDGQTLERGNLYIAPPDRHLVVADGEVRLVRGPRENRHRPAIDPLFRSAAEFYRDRVIGVVLTGYLDDGAAGLRDIQTCGGITVVQDPADALFPEMPQNALEMLKPDYTVAVAEMGPLLTRLITERSKNSRPRPVPPKIKKETDIAEMKYPLNDMRQQGEPSGFACPECHGVLWEMKDQNLVRFRCRVGHAYSKKSLEASLSSQLENSLWTATRALEEKVSMLKRLARDSRKRKHTLSARQFELRLKELEPAALTLRTLLLKTHS